MDNRHHPFDVIFGAALGLLLAWMAYRQYFPALYRAEGGRPYSISEFATEKSERPPATYNAPATYSGREPDVEMGVPRPRRKDIPGSDGWTAESYRDESPRVSSAPLREEVGYSRPGASQSPAMFPQDTGYRR
jgi:hypothetical protein